MTGSPRTLLAIVVVAAALLVGGPAYGDNDVNLTESPEHSVPPPSQEPASPPGHEPEPEVPAAPAPGEPEGTTVPEPEPEAVPPPDPTAPDPPSTAPPPTDRPPTDPPPPDPPAPEPRPSEPELEVPAEAIRSVTVSPAVVTFGDCVAGDGTPTGAELTLPGGRCAASLTVTNGAAPARMHVRATDLEGDGGAAWRLVAGPGGSDEVALVLGDGVAVGRADACDQSWNPHAADIAQRCLAAPGQSTTPRVTLHGPPSTTHAATTYSTTITWRALP